MSSTPVKRKLAAILAADAVGYSRMMAADEEGTMKILAAHRAVIDGIIQFHEGRIVNTAGDSVIADFASPTQAVRCAVEIQDALKTRNDALSEARKMEFRIGVNLGDVMVKGEDLLGDGVNVAARLEGIAEPGSIYLSSSVYDQISGKLDLGFVDLGEQALKNIDRPIRAYRVNRERGSATVAARKPRHAVALWVAAVVAVIALGGGIAWYLEQQLSIRQEQEARAKAEAESAKAKAGAEIVKARVKVEEVEIARARAEAEEARKTAASDSGAAAVKLDALALELKFWESVKDSRNANELRAYLDQYTNGKFAQLAQARINALEAVPKTQVAAVEPSSAPSGSGPSAKLEELRSRALLLGFDGVMALAHVKMGRNVDQEVAWLNGQSQRLGISDVSFPSDPWGANRNGEPFLAYSQRIITSLGLLDRRVQHAFAVGMFGVITTVTPSLKPPGFDLRKVANEAGLPARPEMTDRDYVQWLADQARSSIVMGK